MSAVQVPSFTDPEKTYSILVDAETGAAACTCPGYEYRGTCRHIKYVREEMAETSTALVPVVIQPPTRTLPAVSELQSMDLVAAQLAETRAISLPAGIKSKEDIRAVILAGWEWGIRPMEALRCFHLIKGQVTPSAETMAGMVSSREADVRFEVVEMTDEKVTMRFIRPSRKIKAEYTYTMADAKKAGLAGKDNWAGHPKDMMRWAATRRLIRVYAPDLIHNFGSAAAAVSAGGDTDEDYDYSPPSRAEAVEAVVSAPLPEPEPAPQAPTPQTPVDLINAIGKAHGPEAMRTARALSKKLYGKDLLALSDAERADYRDVLRFLLANQAHEHELSYTATGDPVCRLCGEPVDPRVLEEAAQKAALPFK